MGFLDFLFKPPAPYHRIAVWIKENYRDRFQAGMSRDEVRIKLKSILDEERRKGVKPEVLRGFERYVNEMNYSDLVRTVD